eukprot:7123560-Prymnesium_polylepis.2
MDSYGMRTTNPVHVTRRKSSIVSPVNRCVASAASDLDRSRQRPARVGASAHNQRFSTRTAPPEPSGTRRVRVGGHTIKELLFVSARQKFGGGRDDTLAQLLPVHVE